MKGAETAGLVPRLRFPEFRNSTGWVARSLDEIASFYKGKGLPKAAIDLDGAYPCIHYGELFTHYQEVIAEVRGRTNLKDNVFVSVPGDVLMPTSDVTPNGLAKACCVTLGGVILGGDILVIRTNGLETDGSFLARHVRHLEKNVLKLVSGSTVFHLYASSVAKLQLSIPSIREQQKISDCLSSLDEVITLESQKLEALKIHKKGLMQQLFPAEGETVPRLRFPEFRAKDVWEVRALTDVCRKICQGGTPDTSEPEYWNGEIQWLTPAEMGKRETPYVYRSVRGITVSGLENCSSDLLPVDSVIISTRAPIGHLAINKSEMAINQGCKGLIPGSDTVGHFLYYILYGSKQALNDIGAGNTFKEITGSSLGRFKIALPGQKEQQKIADCLSSLDEVITLESQKLEALKIHKKGLMQQLFPSAEDLGN